MTIHFIDKKRLDTEKLVELYANGRWKGGRPIYYWMTSDKKRFFIERQSFWQGEHSSIEELEREEMIEALINAAHPDRGDEGLKLMGASEEIEDIE